MKKLYLYYIDDNYLRYLSSIDNEVYYDVSYIQNKKPFVGIVLNVNGIKYFAPLTSSKQKHTSWKMISDKGVLIYEIANNSNLSKNGVFFKKDTNLYHLLGVLDYKKMIPVKKGLYSKIDVNNISDHDYRNLLQKEYNFIKNISTKIINRIKKMYNKQITTGRVLIYHCDFKKLEQAMKNYQNR